MAGLKTKASVAKGLQFSQDEKHRNNVRIQVKDFAGRLKVRKWNYAVKKWGKWALLV